ncbi:MAG: sigma-70 family RNA polymerase sigma factor [Nitriliruptoraceae bacterium]
MRPDDAAFQARLAAARDGDDVAWVELYHELAPIIIGYLRAQRLPDAEDVAGEVLLELVRDLHRFEGDADNLRSWALAITHHRLLDARRRLTRRPQRSEAATETDELPGDDDPEAETLAGLGFGRLEPALRTLTEEQRTVLLLRVIGDLSVAEVARITGKRSGAVKQLQRRAVDAMRRHLRAAAASGEATAIGDPQAAATEAATEAATATPRGQRPAQQRGDRRRARAHNAHPVSEASLQTLSERDGRDDDGR